MKESTENFWAFIALVVSIAVIVSSVLAAALYDALRPEPEICDSALSVNIREITGESIEPDETVTVIDAYEDAFPTDYKAEHIKLLKELRPHKYFSEMSAEEQTAYLNLISRIDDSFFSEGAGLTAHDQISDVWTTVTSEPIPDQTVDPDCDDPQDAACGQSSGIGAEVISTLDAEVWP